ncbi:MAG: homoserine kinase [Woeseiaceae bacterium]|nr:homoserine kinase [Woeseiaceae bacterium]
MTRCRTATAFAPASIGNVAVGFDMLGLAVAGVGDRVTARRSDEPGIRLDEVRDPDGRPHASLAARAEENTATVAARAFWETHGDGGGVTLCVHKGIPLASGMGSSAASAVAGAVAVNALLDVPLAFESLLPYALAGEELASGAVHADNVAPSLIGGLVLCPPVLLPRVLRLDVPDDLCSVLLHPELEISTAESRKSLAATYTLGQWLQQQGYLAAFIAALCKGDRDLLRASLRDVVIEPQRKAAVPCFDAVQSAALDAGAFGSSLSGSGPSLFAICAQDDGEAVRAAMQAACRSAGIACDAWISPLSAAGARVEERK